MMSPNPHLPHGVPTWIELRDVRAGRGQSFLSVELRSNGVARILKRDGRRDEIEFLSGGYHPESYLGIEFCVNATEPHAIAAALVVHYDLVAAVFDVLEARWRTWNDRDGAASAWADKQDRARLVERYMRLRFALAGGAR